MSETFLLSSAKYATYLRIALATIGIAVVLYGAADILSRIAHATFLANANAVAFGPAVVSLDTPAAPAFAPSSTPLLPTRLVVPAIGIDASVVGLGQKADGSMAAPSSFTAVGWYTLGSEPGAQGNAVIAGHVNNALTKAGIFEHLSDIALGDIIVVTDAQGHTLRFAVRDIEDYPSASAPLSQIFSTSGPSQLVLITCAGDWDPETHSYDHRLVVYAGLLAHQ